MEIESTYTDDNAGMYATLPSPENELADDVKMAKLFSLLINDSTNESDYDNEVLVALCDTKRSDEKIHT